MSVKPEGSCCSGFCTKPATRRITFTDGAKFAFCKAHADKINAPPQVVTVIQRD